MKIFGSGLRTIVGYPGFTRGTYRHQLNDLILDQSKRRRGAVLAYWFHNGFPSLAGERQPAVFAMRAELAAIRETI